MLFAKEQYPNKRLDELITVNGYAIDIPLGMQELPVFWHNNYPLVEKIRNERIKHGVVILDDLIDNATSTVVVEPEDDEEVPIVPPKGKRKPKQLESKSDGNIRRTLDRALRRLNIETTTPIYNGMGDADGTYADPVLEEWPEGEIERGEDIERQRAELRAARMLEGNDVTIPDAGGRGVPNEEKGTPGVFPAESNTGQGRVSSGDDETKNDGGEVALPEVPGVQEAVPREGEESSDMQQPGVQETPEDRLAASLATYERRETRRVHEADETTQPRSDEGVQGAVSGSATGDAVRGRARSVSDNGNVGDDPDGMSTVSQRDERADRMGSHSSDVQGRAGSDRESATGARDLQREETLEESKGVPGQFPEALKRYWLGKGLSRWATTPTPYRSLVAALRSEGVSGRMVNGLAARLYHWHFGTWPGKNHGKKNFKFTDYDGVQAVKLEEKKLHGDETKDGDA